MESTTKIIAKNDVLPCRISRAIRFAEWLALFFGVPLVLAQGWLSFPKLILLFGVTALCFICLRLDKTFDRKRLGGISLLKTIWKPLLLRVIICAVLLFLFCWLFFPEYLFGFVKRHPKFWAIVFVCYPFLSAWPQELIYRAFMFQRYQKVFNNPKLMVLASAAAFAFLHVIYINWVSLALTFIGGLFFAHSYQKTERLAPAFIEHAIYGNLVFTFGIGAFFFRAL